jgi:hypothetical protein
MKNIFKYFWIIALVAIIGFAMTVCNNPSKNQFLGTWSTIQMGMKVEIFFTDKNFTYTINDGIDYPSVGGTYTYKNDTATLNMDDSDGSVDLSASVYGNTLVYKIGGGEAFRLTKK